MAEMPVMESVPSGPRRRLGLPLATGIFILVLAGSAAALFGFRKRGVAMLPIPAGTLEMGSNDGDPDERPAHRVTVAAFEIDATEVTTEAYAACVQAGRCQAPSTFHAGCNGLVPAVPHHPVNCVTWQMASTFCQWRGARLPTEQEWEYAARGPRSQRFPWGPERRTDASCWNRPASNPRTCQVGAFPLDRSPFGVLDTAGNVAEWTQSAYCHFDGTGCEPGARVIKGASCDMAFDLWLHSSYRDFVPEGQSGYNLGFRCARSAN
jgi:formylglycine-generating enzyme required for sulfatase activity